MLIDFKEIKNQRQCNFANFPENHCFTHKITFAKNCRLDACHSGLKSVVHAVQGMLHFIMSLSNQKSVCRKIDCKHINASRQSNKHTTMVIRSGKVRSPLLFTLYNGILRKFLFQRL